MIGPDPGRSLDTTPGSLVPSQSKRVQARRMPGRGVDEEGVCISFADAAVVAELNWLVCLKLNQGVLDIVDHFFFAVGI